MKKIFAVVLATVLSFSVLNSAKAVDIAEGAPGVWGAVLHTNGKVVVANWDVWSNDSRDNYAAFNYTGKDSGWSQGVLIENAETLSVTVLKNGTAFLFYEDNGSYKFITTKDGEDFSTPVTLPNSTDISSGWNTSITSINNRVVIVGTTAMEDGGLVYSWTSNANLSSWKKKEIGEVYPSSVFADCPVSDENCSYSHANIAVVSNAAGNQALLFMVSVEDTRNEESSEKYAAFASQRKSLTGKWTELQNIDTYGPANISGYHYWPDDFLITPKGKTVIAFQKSFSLDFSMDNAIDVVKVFQSNGVGKSFVSKDAATLTAGFGNGAPNLVNVGEKVYLAYSKEFDNTYLGSEIYLGVVGKMKIAMKPSSLAGHDLVDMVLVKGKPTIITVNESNSPTLAYKATLNAKVSTPSEFLTPAGDKSVMRWGVMCTSLKSSAVCTAGIRASDDPENWDTMGIEATFLK